ncbi:MAG: hypothetical protein EXQ74_07355 [Thermoleophilia bacterium]|nr:hypothetical protein [Thermoleophilia bacterium]
MPVAIRNAVIIFGLAAVSVVWDRVFTGIGVSLSQVISVLFVACLLATGFVYFRRNPLAWLVLRTWQRVLVVVAALGIAVLVVAGDRLVVDRITPPGYFALIIALALLIWWVIRDSRRL